MASAEQYNDWEFKIRLWATMAEFQHQLNLLLDEIGDNGEPLPEDFDKIRSLIEMLASDVALFTPERFPIDAVNQFPKLYLLTEQQDQRYSLCIASVPPSTGSQLSRHMHETAMYVALVSGVMDQQLFYPEQNSEMGKEKFDPTEERIPLNLGVASRVARRQPHMNYCKSGDGAIAVNLYGRSLEAVESFEVFDDGTVSIENFTVPVIDKKYGGQVIADLSFSIDENRPTTILSDREAGQRVFEKYLTITADSSEKQLIYVPKKVGSVFSEFVEGMFGEILGVIGGPEEFFDRYKIFGNQIAVEQFENIIEQQYRDRPLKT
jgi:hypothetical protein